MHISIADINNRDFAPVAAGMKAVVAMVFVIAISCIVGIVVAVICCRRRQARRGLIYTPTPGGPTGPPTLQTQCKDPGAIQYYQCRNSHYKDETVVRPSYLYNGNSRLTKDCLDSNDLQTLIFFIRIIYKHYNVEFISYIFYFPQTQFQSAAVMAPLGWCVKRPENLSTQGFPTCSTPNPGLPLVSRTSGPCISRAIWADVDPTGPTPFQSVCCFHQSSPIIHKFDNVDYTVLTHWGRVYASVNLPSLLQIMAWRLAGAKPLSEPMLEYC